MEQQLGTCMERGRRCRVEEGHFRQTGQRVQKPLELRVHGMFEKLKKASVTATWKIRWMERILEEKAGGE